MFTMEFLLYHLSFSCSRLEFPICSSLSVKAIRKSITGKQLTKTVRTKKCREKLK